MSWQTMLNSKCHNQQGYPYLYKAEQFTLSLGWLLACLECYITYVTCAVMICLICPQAPLGTAHPHAHAHISGKSLLPMLQI